MRFFASDSSYNTSDEASVKDSKMSKSLFVFETSSTIYFPLLINCELNIIKIQTGLACFFVEIIAWLTIQIWIKRSIICC